LVIKYPTLDLLDLFVDGAPRRELRKDGLAFDRLGDGLRHGGIVQAPKGIAAQRLRRASRKAQGQVLY
jgi:hypothetical protein